MRSVRAAKKKRLPVKAASPVGRRGEQAIRAFQEADNLDAIPPEPEDKSRTIVRRLKPEQTPEAATAEMAIEGVGHNVVTAAEFSKCFYSEPDLTELMAAQMLAIEAVHKGDLKEAKAPLGPYHGALGVERSFLRPRRILSTLRGSPPSGPSLAGVGAASACAPPPRLG
jgi:hypothetical protein